MGYYDEKKRELKELLRLVRKEKDDFLTIAKLEREGLDKDIRLLSELGIYDEKESPLKKFIEVKDKLNREVAEFEKYKKEAESRIGKERAELESYKKEAEARIAKDREAIIELAKQKSEGFPWLANAYADYFHLKDLWSADDLQYKPHPALKAAEQVREIASKRRIAEKLYRVLKYQLEYYERLFPWLIDFKSEDIDDLVIQLMEKKEESVEALEEPVDPVKKWLTPEEYKNLPSVERNQRALDRWWKKPKSKWEIGRDYERYIGYVYESRGYAVYYQGIVAGLADLGRDLMCAKDDNVEIVQCKYWSREKQIHEKHIFQLYGTVVAYEIDHPEKKASAFFITSTSLSDRAKQFANVLKIEFTENRPLERYPCIKCNVSRRDEAKIYHLPFDQQYDRTLVEEERNECYVETVAQAEAQGFRRAFRWRGESPE